MAGGVKAFKCGAVRCLDAWGSEAGSHSSFPSAYTSPSAPPLFPAIISGATWPPELRAVNFHVTRAVQRSFRLPQRRVRVVLLSLAIVLCGVVERRSKGKATTRGREERVKIRSPLSQSLEPHRQEK